MKYYLLTHDPRHGSAPPLLLDRINERRRLGKVAWRNAGGQRLSDEMPDTTLWGLRAGFLLVDAGLKPGWVERFSDDGIRETALGERPMFTSVMDAVTKEIYGQPGHWQDAQYYSCYLWPAPEGRRMREQPWNEALNLDLVDPVVRRWDGNSLSQLYSQDVIDWLRDQGATGATFSLVWDPDRLTTLPIAHRHPHETVTL